MRIILLLYAFASSVMAAGYCDLIGTEIYAQDKISGLGTFLGVVTDNPYLSESILNKYGVYGSKYSSTSILNEYGSFGGPYSSYSPFNPYTTTPPVILSWDNVSKRYSFVAYLTKNKYIGDTYADPDILFSTLSAGCGGIYVPPVASKPDLIIDSLQVYISKNKDSVYVSYIIANIGGATANKVAALAATEALSRIDTVYFNPLNPGKYFSHVSGFKVNSDTTIIIVAADPLKWVDEESEENNLGAGVYLTPIPTTAARQAKRPKAVTPFRFSYDLLGRLREQSPRPQLMYPSHPLR